MLNTIRLDDLPIKFQILLLGQGIGNALLEACDPAIIDYLSTGKIHTFNLLPGSALNGMQHALLSWCNKEDGIALAACTAGTTNTVHIGLGIIGDIVIDDMTDTRHVQPASSNIGSNQDIQLPIL